MNIYRYTFSSSSAQCQPITNIYYGRGSLMISNSQFFVLSTTKTSPYNLQMYKITFSLTSVDWANQMLCGDPVRWNSNTAESMLSSDGSTIYSLFTYGGSIFRYLYFCGLSVSDGRVTTTRYKSDDGIAEIYGSALNGDYIVNLKSSADN